MKSIIATGILLSVSAPALAGPYANVESNTTYFGEDYVGTVTELAVGYEGELGEKGKWYVQGGPALVAIDDQDSEVEFAGKAGLGFEVREDLSIYGEYAWLGGEELGSAVKAGVKYNF